VKLRQNREETKKNQEDSVKESTKNEEDEKLEFEHQWRKLVTES
jgi:hypothetical protein